MIGFNVSKSLSGNDLCLLRLVVRTSGFHPGNRGSTPLGDIGLMYITYYRSPLQDKLTYTSVMTDNAVI